MKTVVDHSIRQKMGVTCDEYVFLDAVVKKECIKRADLKKTYSFSEAELVALVSSLHSKHYIEPSDEEGMELTEKALKYFKPDNSNLVYDVITFLNKESGAKFQAHSKPTIQIINARVADGYTLEDFQKVIKHMCKEWLHTPQEMYLRPITLLGNKFEGYLQAAIRAEPKAPENKNMEGMVM